MRVVLTVNLKPDTVAVPPLEMPPGTTIDGTVMQATSGSELWRTIVRPVSVSPSFRMFNVTVPDSLVSGKASQSPTPQSTSAEQDAPAFGVPATQVPAPPRSQVPHPSSM